MADPVSVLLVGGGRMGSGHLQAIRALPELGRVVAGVDPSADARGRLREEFGIERPYADLDAALVAEEAPAVFVCAPNYLHSDYAL